MVDFNFDITESGLLINSQLLNFPINAEVIQEILGAPRLKPRIQSKIVFGVLKDTKPFDGSYTWDSLGVYAFVKKGVITQFGMQVIKDSEADWRPTSNVRGSIKIAGKNHQTLQKKEKDWLEIILGKCRLEIEFNDAGDVNGITVSENLPEAASPLVLSYKKYLAERIEPVFNLEMYQYKPIAGEKLVFKDFNFKLCVIQVLMYELNVLKPKLDFTLDKVVQGNTEDDWESDNDDYIYPKQKAYFEQLEIPLSLAELITEIYQDVGADEVYQYLSTPDWTGEDVIYDVKGFEDVSQFKNLKYITMYFNDDENQADLNKIYLKNLGITVVEL